MCLCARLVFSCLWCRQSYAQNMHELEVYLSKCSTTRLVSLHGRRWREGEQCDFKVFAAILLFVRWPCGVVGSTSIINLIKLKEQPAVNLNRRRRLPTAWFVGKNPTGERTCLVGAYSLVVLFTTVALQIYFACILIKFSHVFGFLAG